jgi:hypothetical protein
MKNFHLSSQTPQIVDFLPKEPLLSIVLVAIAQKTVPEKKKKYWVDAVYHSLPKFVHPLCSSRVQFPCWNKNNKKLEREKKRKSPSRNSPFETQSEAGKEEKESEGSQAAHRLFVFLCFCFFFCFVATNVDALLELARLLYVPRFSQCVSVLSCSLL